MMSQIPQPDSGYTPTQPLQYAQPYFRPKLRPTSVTVLAIIGIIWASLVLLGSVINILQFAGVTFGGDNPITRGMHDDRFLYSWTLFGVVVGVIQGVLLLFGSIWSLSLKRSGRSWLILFA